MKKCSWIFLSLLTAFCLTGCSPQKLPTSEHLVMMTARETNWGEVLLTDDFWCASYWTIYYDGTAEYYEDYNLSGVSNERSWTLSGEDLLAVYRILYSTKNIENDHSSGCDGTGWKITFYDEEQEVINDYSGYIYSIDDYMRLQDLISVPGEPSY